MRHGGARHGHMNVGFGLGLLFSVIFGVIGTSHAQGVSIPSNFTATVVEPHIYINNGSYMNNNYNFLSVNDDGSIWYTKRVQTWAYPLNYYGHNEAVYYDAPSGSHISFYYPGYVASTVAMAMNNNLDLSMMAFPMGPSSGYEVFVARAFGSSGVSLQQPSGHFHAMNDLGVAVGRFSYAFSHAAFWVNDQGVDLNSLIPQPPNRVLWNLHDLNNSLQAVGYSVDSPYLNTVLSAFFVDALAPNYGFQILSKGIYADTVPNAINSSGQIVGYGKVSGLGEVPTLWQSASAPVVQLPLPSGAIGGVAKAISDTGIVGGYLYFPAAANPQVAALWDANNLTQAPVLLDGSNITNLPAGTQNIDVRAVLGGGSTPLKVVIVASDAAAMDDTNCTIFGACVPAHDSLVVLQ